MAAYSLSSSDSAQRISVGQRIGNYRIERLLGEGGMGLVFESCHVNTGGRAAIKILRTEVASRQDVVARFFNEARATTAVEHPGIVRVFDCGYSEDGVAYLTMEFLDGESLSARIERQQRLEQPDALRIGRQVASALRAAHAKGIIHRDLKPENVMLIPDLELPSGERAKLVDFGIAKVNESSQVRTSPGLFLGTPQYMSPEQCRNAKMVTDRADVYSLGVMLYEMLCGRVPFESTQTGDLIWMHMTQVPQPIEQLVPDVAPPTSELIMSMLEKDPTLRPSMEAVAKELGRLLNSEDSLHSASEERETKTPPLHTRETTEFTLNGGRGMKTQPLLAVGTPEQKQEMSAFSPSLLPPGLRATANQQTTRQPAITISQQVVPLADTELITKPLSRPRLAWWNATSALFWLVGVAAILLLLGALLLIRSVAKSANEVHSAPGSNVLSATIL